MLYHVTLAEMLIAMIAQEEIDNQLQLLQAHRRTLAAYMRQQATIGEAYSPPALLHGIAETRSHIKRIKSRLQTIGIAVPEDFDDDEPQIVAVAPHVSRRARSGLIISLIGVALLPIIGLTLRPFGGILAAPVSGASPSAPSAADTTSSRPAQSGEAPQVPPLPTIVALTGGQSWLDKLTSVTEIEPLLVLANIPLALPEDEERTRAYFIGPNSAYRALAIAALKVVGERRFHRPIYLDQIDKWYTQMSGPGYAKHGPLDLEKVKRAMLKANNDYYTDNTDSLDALLEPRN